MWFRGDAAISGMRARYKNLAAVFGCEQDDLASSLQTEFVGSKECSLSKGWEESESDICVLWYCHDTFYLFIS